MAYQDQHTLNKIVESDESKSDTKITSISIADFCDEGVLDVEASCNEGEVSYNLDSLNMKYVSADQNDYFDGGAILECGHWDKDQLESYLSGYDLDMIEAVQDWVSGEAYIAEGLYLKVWVE